MGALAFLSLSLSEVILNTLIDALSDSIPDWARKNASIFCAILRYKLECTGCTVRAEVEVPNRGDGRKGRIDLVVDHPFKAAIEVDRKTVRKKSIYKLSMLPDYEAITIIRDRRS